MSDMGTLSTALFVPLDYLAFVERCRVAGICLPTRAMAQSELGAASYYPVGHNARKRYWAGHEEKPIYWFTFGMDEGALTCWLEEGAEPEMTVPYSDKCDVCPKAKWHPRMVAQ